MQIRIRCPFLVLIIFNFLWQLTRPGIFWSQSFPGKGFGFKFLEIFGLGFRFYLTLDNFSPEKDNCSNEGSLSLIFVGITHTHTLESPKYIILDKSKSSSFGGIALNIKRITGNYWGSSIAVGVRTGMRGGN
jgi:hypothetical protein